MFGVVSVKLRETISEQNNSCFECRSMSQKDNRNEKAMEAFEGLMSYAPGSWKISSLLCICLDYLMWTLVFRAIMNLIILRLGSI